MTLRTEPGYLVRKNRQNNRAHIWTGTDTACRMWSTGGMGGRGYEVQDTPGTRGICQMCSDNAKDGRLKMGPTIDEKYRHMRGNAEAFVVGMKTMVAALERDGRHEEATNLRVWCLMPWEAAIRDDDAGDIWPICEACGDPIKNYDELVSGDDCDLHHSCTPESKNGA